MPDDQQKIVTSGFDAFVTKPINLKHFLDTVQRFLAERAPGADDERSRAGFVESERLVAGAVLRSP